MTFEELGLHASILQAVQDLGFVNCMPVQEQAIPHILYNDINLVALAQTGTGKTAAFGLPVINNIVCRSENNAYNSDNRKRKN
ncbi:MAG: DEAD/DEAH box helicase, partial [Bacteroidales bacterium]|nr:DEAD/DEAH box helicase [Bacteroidales bacterium]